MSQASHFMSGTNVIESKKNLCCLRFVLFLFVQLCLYCEAFATSGAIGTAAAAKPADWNLPSGYKYVEPFEQYYRKSVAAMLSRSDSVYELQTLKIGLAIDKPYRGPYGPVWIPYPISEAFLVPEYLGERLFDGGVIDLSNLPEVGPHIVYSMHELATFYSVFRFDFHYLTMVFRRKGIPNSGNLKVHCGVSVNEVVLNSKHHNFMHYERLISGHVWLCGTLGVASELIDINDIDISDHPQWRQPETVQLVKGLKGMGAAQQWVLRSGANPYLDFFNAVRDFRSGLRRVSQAGFCSFVDQHMVQLHEHQASLLLGLRGAAYEIRLAQTNHLFESLLEHPAVDKCLRPQPTEPI